MYVVLSFRYNFVLLYSTFKGTKRNSFENVFFTSEYFLLNMRSLKMELMRIDPNNKGLNRMM